MKFTRYTKYVPDPASEMSMEELINALSDYLLQSGFQQQYMNFYELGQDQTLEDLRRAIEQALANGELFDEQLQQQIEHMRMEGAIEELIERIIERMQQEDYISIDQPQDPSKPSAAPGQTGDVQGNTR